MSRKAVQSMLSLALGALLVVPSVNAATKNSQVRPAKAEEGLHKEIRRELITLPWFSIFDNFAYKLDGNRVTLYGQVTRPTLKTSAQRVIERIEGIEHVDNQIEVLPLSPMDDRIRIAVANAVYSGPLYRYGLGANPPIRIIVKNGHVTLAGVVANEFDRNVANLRANGVSGVFSVTNHLQVENKNS